MGKQTITDVVSGTLTYYGEAELGRATTDKFWSIKKTSISGGVTTVSYPIGSNGTPSKNEEFGWDERASLNYSLTDDVTAPTLTTVTIASDNSTTTLAKPGDTITITIVASEYIKNIIATIAGNPATVTEGVDDKNFTLTYDMVQGDENGVIPFTIDFTDIAGRPGVQVTEVTSGGDVTYDKTAPTLDSAIRDSDTQVTVTLSELAIEASITKANAGGFVAYETGTPATTYAVSGIAPGATDDEVVLTLADISGSIAEGITITYVAGGNGTVADLAGNLLATDAVGVIIPTWA